MLNTKTQSLAKALLYSNILTPQALMAIEILTIEILATYALTHH